MQDGLKSAGLTNCRAGESLEGHFSQGERKQPWVGGEALHKGARSPKWDCTQVSTNQQDEASGLASTVPASCVTLLPVPGGPSSAFSLLSPPGLIGDDLFRLKCNSQFKFWLL